MEPHDDSEMPHSMPPCKRLKKDQRHGNLTLKNTSLYSQDDTAYGNNAPCKALRNETSMTVQRMKGVPCDEGDRGQRTEIDVPDAKRNDEAAKKALRGRCQATGSMLPRPGLSQTPPSKMTGLPTVCQEGACDSARGLSGQEHLRPFPGETL